MTDTDEKPKIALFLAGGGARAAYQVGVIKAIAEMLPEDSPNPFPILCGSSAGAINATTLAIYATQFQEGARRLGWVWRNFRVHHVFRSDMAGVMASGSRWLVALLMGGLGRRNPTSLLDRAPLRRLLNKTIPCEQIQKSIDAGALYALSVTASGYTSGQSVTFYQGVSTIAPWKRARRIGSACLIGIDHLMASSAIPFVFSAVKINREYFGDGSMRQIAPLSPALHLGADRVLVVGVRQENTSEPRAAAEETPSLAQIAGHVLNSIFLDSLEADLERLQRINKTISLISSAQLYEGGITLRRVETLVIAPSEELEKIAARHAHHLPRPIRFLLRGLGGFRRGGSNLVSYLLFEKPYCRELIDLGYKDAMHRREEILRFLEMPSA
ncbi:MAG: patatin-like phospholipase family protein [Pseudomonadota bacterium]